MNIWDVLVWLGYPIIGLIAGILVGLTYRSSGQKIDTNSKKVWAFDIGAGIGLAIVVLSHIGLFIFWPDFLAGIDMLDYSLGLAVGFVFYVIIANLVAIQVANHGKKKE